MSQKDLLSILGGRYRNLQVIGTGGMGIVYLAVDNQTGQTVALKLLKPAVVAQAPDLLERFIHEGEALRRLNHPNIVKVLDTFEESGQHCIVMEYVSGGSLADLLKRQTRLSVSQTLSIALEVADALSRAHHLKIIHRDIKPDNVLLADDGTPRLSDFGVAHLAESEITQSGMVMGTYPYLCPEAFDGRPLDARADIWAFGVMLFETLSGQRPFEGETLVAIMTAVVSTPTPDLERLCPDVPVALVDLIYRMLEKDRDQRIASMRMVGAELEKLLRDSDGTPGPRPARPPSTIMADEATSFAIPTPAENELTPHDLHNLPAQITPFVGREAELDELTKLLSASRLVTVLGPGGMGKTRLSLETAAVQLGAFTSGVYFVALAPLGTVEGIVEAIAEAVRYSFYSGPEPRQQLLDYLHAKHILLILDNFEHLLNGASLVSDILRAAPEVKILVTSRERLNVEGETIFRLEGMDFPDWGVPEDAAEFSAVKLFLQSARRVQPEFALSVGSLKYVARICRMVQGMPLGILLAAAWVEALPLPEIAQEIEKSLDFLETEQRDLPTRHRSLRAAFDYSWNLLGDADRDAFKKLSVFRGGFTREAAQQVADASLKTLIMLVNKSLLRRNATSGRYEVHELLRQYGEEQLDKSAVDSEKCRALHCAFFAALLQQMWKDLTNLRQMAAFEAIGVDFNNILVAWNYAVAHRRADLLRMMAFSLWYYGDQRLPRTAAFDLYARAAAAMQMNAAEPDSRIALGLMLVLQGNCDFENSLSYIKPGLAILRQFDCPAETVCALINLALKAQSFHDMSHGQEGEQTAQEGLRIAKENDLPWGIAQCLALLAVNVALQGDLIQARQIGDEAYRALLAVGNVSFISGFAIHGLGPIAMGLYDYGEAERQFEEGLRWIEENERERRQQDGQGSYNAISACVSLGQVAIFQEDVGKLENRIRQAFQWVKRANSSLADRFLVDFGRLFAEVGKNETAVELLTLATVKNDSLPPHQRGTVNTVLVKLQAALAADDFAAAVELGKTLDFQQFVADYLAK